jgi:hypothetical protein
MRCGKHSRVAVERVEGCAFLIAHWSDELGGEDR